MKYAIISDLHANLEALEAVLADMRPHADAVICLGDIVGYNANPNECLELVQNAARRRHCGQSRSGGLRSPTLRRFQ